MVFRCCAILGPTKNPSPSQNCSAQSTYLAMPKNKGENQIPPKAENFSGGGGCLALGHQFLSFVLGRQQKACSRAAHQETANQVQQYTWLNCGNQLIGKNG